MIDNFKTISVCTPAESDIQMAKIESDSKNVLPDVGHDVDTDNYILELSNHSLKFEPVSEENSVFYDESNRQVSKQRVTMKF